MYSGRFTHISGNPSAVGRAQERESSPVWLRAVAYTHTLIVCDWGGGNLWGNVSKGGISADMACRLRRSVDVTNRVFLDADVDFFIPSLSF